MEGVVVITGEGKLDGSDGSDNSDFSDNSDGSDLSDGSDGSEDWDAKSKAGPDCLSEPA